MQTQPLIAPDRLALIAAQAERRMRYQQPERYFHLVDDGFFIGIKAPKLASPLRPWSLVDEGDWVLYFQLLHVLRCAGWWVRQDRETKRHYRSIAKAHHQGARGGMRFRAKVYPTGMEFSFYPDRNPANAAGPQYAFRYTFKGVLTFWDCMIHRDAVRRLVATLRGEGMEDRSEIKLLTPYEQAEWLDRTTGHHKGQLSIEVDRDARSWHQDYNRTDGDGCILHNGDERYAYDYETKRLVRGRAFYGLNSRWMLVTPERVLHLDCYELVSFSPHLPRRCSVKHALASVDRLLAQAVKEEQFERAIILRRRRDELRAMAAPQVPRKVAGAA